MDASIHLRNSPLYALSSKSQKLISYLLNTKKVLPSDGPEKLPRDWRGLAAQVNITSEIATFIEQHEDKTAKILEIWSKKNDGTANVEIFLKYLQKMDRYDVYDDLLELQNNGELLGQKTAEYSQCNQINVLEDEKNDLITFDDMKHGSPQLYHAYVLYAKEDKSFVDELLQRMKVQGYMLCTEDDLLPGHSTQFAPVSQLISTRCHRIILVYSPDFLNSTANKFYMDYAQAVSIQNKVTNLIPCMYRQCQLPTNLIYYHKLYYTPPGEKAVYDFWDKLSRTLATVNLPRLTNGTTSCKNSSIDITEYKSQPNSYSAPMDFLALPSAGSSRSLSYTNIDALKVTLPSDDSKSLSNISQSSEQKSKKMSKIKKLYNNLRGKKKKALMIEN